MKIRLAYGKKGLFVELPDEDYVEVIEPNFVPGLPDERETIWKSLRKPIASPPLQTLVKSDDTVSIVFSDLTRPMPNGAVLPVLLEELSHIPRSNILLINALGTHRPQTKEELVEMLGRKVVENYRIIQHDCSDRKSLVYLGASSFGHPIWVNRAYMESSVRILTGLIEPHFFAGFSGGPKAVLPGVAGKETILRNHGADMISALRASWLITEGNPIWEEISEAAAMTNPTFLLNVTINPEKKITGVFAGDVREAHAQGADFVREVAKVPVDKLFDIVITTNSGYPLDLNLYQAVKGMSAAAQVVKEGGSIIVAAECRDGIPNHAEYGRILKKASSPQEILETINSPGCPIQDQWEAQIQALVQLKADVYVKSSFLTDRQIRDALLLPCHSIENTLKELQSKYGPRATICVLPEGPQTIPYVDAKS